MDVGYTYSTADGHTQASVYAHPDYEVPSTFQLRTSDGTIIQLLRVSDRDMVCHNLPGEKGARRCTSDSCHRAVLGECRCGRHPSPVPFSIARAPQNQETTR